MAAEAPKKGFISEIFKKGVLGSAFAIALGILLALPTYIALPISIGFVVGGTIGLIGELAR